MAARRLLVILRPIELEMRNGDILHTKIVVAGACPYRIMLACVVAWAAASFWEFERRSRSRGGTLPPSPFLLVYFLFSGGSPIH
mmetsp:Transcript_31647/g.47223  ORF Transcript_31647/g.47223 Transcript_31647/m.47223 type:complete len:84 (-) Transcript_31647:94-345(-)